MNGTGPGRGGTPDAPAATTTLVVSGVSGAGKSTVARLLVERTGWAFTEGDDLHPESNRRKMASGTPLDDADRLPWLHRIAEWIGAQESAGRDAVVTCSALRRGYRDLLRGGHPSVRFVLLTADHDVLDRRLRSRQGHFMPVALLDSQLATAEPLAPDEPGAAYTCDVASDEVAARVLADLPER